MADSKRKAHVKRVYKIVFDPETKKEVLSTDIFVDVLRIDECVVNFQSTDDEKLGQIIKYVLKWNDDKDNPLDNIDASAADIQFENANAKRKTEKRRIVDPGIKTDKDPLPEGSSESATSIDDNDIYLWIMKRVKIIMPRGEITGREDQIVQFVFNNRPLFDDSEGPPSNRTTSVIKVVNNDLGGLKMATEPKTDGDGADEDPQAIIRDWDTYRKALEDGKTDTDDELYLTVEFTDDFTVNFGPDAERGLEAQGIKHVLGNNRAIEDMFAKGDPKALDLDGKSALIRLDPLQLIVNVGSNIIAVEFKPEAYEYVAPVKVADASKITLSTWVYISKESVDAQAKVVAAKTLDPHFASDSVRSRIPIMEFGNSIEPLVGVHIGMSMTWEGYLGFFWWYGFLDAPYFPDYTAGYWIGGKGRTRKGWFPFVGGKAIASVDYSEEWKNVNFVFLGTAASGVGTDFYYMPPGTVLPPIHPTVRYDGFDDTGILPYNVYNAGTGDFPAYPGGDHFGKFAHPTSWTFRGEMKALVVNVPNRISVLPKDIVSAADGLLVESEILFNNFWSSPLNYTMQPTPTPVIGDKPDIRVDTGPGSGKYFAYGDMVLIFPKRPNATYATEEHVTAIPSTLFCEGENIKFLLTGRWPEKTTPQDDEVVPTLTFSAGGFKVDSWNHIFLTVDLTTMVISGGQDDPEKLIWIDTIVGPQLVPEGLRIPEMVTPPKWAMYVNGKQAKGDPVPQLTVYPSKDGHWESEKTFKMALKDGQIGLPLIPEEIGRYKTTGPNQKIEYAYTHIWFDKYIEPTNKNLSKFFWKSKNKDYNFVIPPPNKKAATRAFGKPDVWLYRDKAGGVEWKNLGTAGTFKIVGKPKTVTDKDETGAEIKKEVKPPFDYRPGPGQPKRKKTTTTVTA